MRSIIRGFFLAGCLIATSTTAEARQVPAADGRVDNLQTTVRGGRVQFEFDITADPAATFSVSVEVSIDGGRTYSGLKTITGDVGNDIGPGHKKAVWDAAKDVEALALDSFRYRVVLQRTKPVVPSAPPPGSSALPAATTPSPAPQPEPSHLKKRLILVSGLAVAVGAGAMAMSKDQDLQKRVDEMNALQPGQGALWDQQFASAQNVMSQRNTWTIVAVSAASVAVGYVVLKKVFRDVSPVPTPHAPTSIPKRQWRVDLDPIHRGLSMTLRF